MFTKNGTYVHFWFWSKISFSQRNNMTQTQCCDKASMHQGGELLCQNVHTARKEFNTVACTYAEVRRHKYRPTFFVNMFCYNFLWGLDTQMDTSIFVSFIKKKEFLLKCTF